MQMRAFSIFLKWWEQHYVGDLEVVERTSVSNVVVPQSSLFYDLNQITLHGGTPRLFHRHLAKRRSGCPTMPFRGRSMPSMDPHRHSTVTSSSGRSEQVLPSLQSGLSLHNAFGIRGKVQGNVLRSPALSEKGQSFRGRARTFFERLGDIPGH